MDEFKREIAFTPAWDKRNADPSKNYGVHGAECHFRLTKGGKGITFAIYTNWMLPNVQKETDRTVLTKGYLTLMHPMGAGVDYHDTKPHHEDQHCREECEITGGKCYSDGSCVMGTDMLALLIAEGSEAVWKRLEELYVEWLEKEMS